jgi:hypothetical protein
LETALYVEPWQTIDDFQTLIAGVLAIVAAGLAARAVLRAAKVSIEAEAARAEELRQRQLSFTRATLNSEWQALVVRTRQVEATIIVTVAAEAIVTEATRARCYLKRPGIVDDWSFMSLLPAQLFARIVQLYALVDAHNLDIDRAGGSFGSDNFQQSLKERLATIRGLAPALAGAPPGEGGAAGPPSQ